MKIKRITILAMLTAIYVVLSILTPVKLQNFKFTFEAFPILVAGFLLGPIDGLIVGTLGSFLYQLLFSGYGLMLTTPLWMFPHMVSGLLVGLLAKRVKKYKFSNVAIISAISALTVTALNTVALYIDSRINGYYSYAVVYGGIPLKICAGLILAVIYTLIMPKLIASLQKIIRQ